MYGKANLQEGGWKYPWFVKLFFIAEFLLLCGFSLISAFLTIVSFGSSDILFAIGYIDILFVFFWWGFVLLFFKKRKSGLWLQSAALFAMLFHSFPMLFYILFEDEKNSIRKRGW